MWNNLFFLEQKKYRPIHLFPDQDAFDTVPVMKFWFLNLTVDHESDLSRHEEIIIL